MPVRERGGKETRIKLDGATVTRGREAYPAFFTRCLISVSSSNTREQKGGLDISAIRNEKKGREKGGWGEREDELGGKC